MSDPMGDARGRVLAGRYRVEEELGRGGMARVFRATDTVLGRPVAVKVLAPQFADDANFVTRFRREAQAAARLNHRNLVGVYDTGSDDGTHFIVMELVEAKTLADFLAGGGRIMPDRAIELTEAVCDALSVAHAQGVIHRDIKPANIMVTRSGDVKVTDFGIARVTSNETVAQTAAVLGTASYLSPEQAQGQPVDARSDIYSLGCVLYEMVTGRPPFSADSAVAVASKHVLETPTPPSRINQDVSSELEAVVLRALSKNPDNRYQSAEEMKADLERVRSGQPVMATPVMPGGTTQVIHRAEPQPTAVMPPTQEHPPEPGRRRAPGWLIALIVIVVLGVLGVLLWLFASEILGGPDEPATQTVTVPDLFGLTLEEATTALADEGLERGDVNERFNEAEEGTVFRQDPAADEPVETGTAVDLWISKGIEQVPVPDVVGEQRSDAEAILAEEGFENVVVNEVENEAPAGEVIGQDPSANTPVDPTTTTVTLTVSEGPGAVTVPDLTCAPIGQATSQLEDLGFQVDTSDTQQFNPDCPQNNHVASLSPTGQQPEGTTITIVPTTSESPTPSPS